MLYFRPLTGVDPYLRIGVGGGGGGGAGHPDPEIEGGLKKNFFQPFGPQFGLKIREVLGPLGPLP